MTLKGLSTLNRRRTPRLDGKEVARTMIELDNNYDRYLGFATGCAYAVAQLSGDAPTIRFDMDDGFNEELFGRRSVR
jgi:hypothetical protein